MFFEGPEKKVELFVAEDFPSLRTFGPDCWNDIVEKAGAKILSKISSSACDAYLLSESSLFVFDKKFIMITCGKTTLVEAIKEATRYIEPEKIEMLFYERKNEIFPHTQRVSFLEEASELNELFDGRAYQFGDADGHHINLFHIDREIASDPTDTTLEILMHGIGSLAREAFGAGGGNDRKARIDRLGVSSIMPGFTTDERFFDPAGYSLNGIDGEAYYTVHVSPEVIGSYASFETNRYMEERVRDDLVRRVVALFEPASFDIVWFTQQQKSRLTFKEDGYIMQKNVLSDLACGYSVSFQSYHKPSCGDQSAIELTLLASTHKERQK